MKKTKGAFIIWDAGDGCLTSKYLEHTSDTTFTEACKLKRESQQSDIAFEGYYIFTWIDYGYVVYNGTLEIKKLTAETYDLNWLILSPKLEYKGKAFIADGNLVGSYWTVR